MRALLTLPLIFVSSFALAEDSKHLSAKDGVEVLHAWVPATSHDHGRIYMEIANEGAADVVLVKASSDIADEIVLVALDYTADGAKEKALGAFPIKANAEIDLTPDGLFLEVDGLNKPLNEGDEFEIRLVFDPIGALDVHVEVEAADATQHSHAGHSH